jgi:hypothetical protein
MVGSASERRREEVARECAGEKHCFDCGSFRLVSEGEGDEVERRAAYCVKTYSVLTFSVLMVWWKDRRDRRFLCVGG